MSIDPVSRLTAAEREIDKLMALHPKGYDLSLDRIRRLLDRLGNPQDNLPPVIHIAGTNGKGSAAAFARSLLEAAGRTVHVHTSPHLVNWHERYRMGRPGGGRLVDDDILAEAIVRVGEANNGQAITVFEILTAVTFILFSGHPADAAIIEVGLGGRFDATNVIAKPAANLIMPIALDHQAHLGDRIELIAAEKAGIIKPGVPVVIGAQEHDAAREVLRDAANRHGCEHIVYGEDFLAHEERGRLVYRDETGLMDLPPPRLVGRHQLANAASAIAVVKVAGFTVEQNAAENAMGDVRWSGRMQRIGSGALLNAAPNGAEIWVDGGHNPGAGQAIAEALAEQEERRPAPLFMIAGMIDTKDQTGFFRPFKGIVRHVYATPITSSDAGVPNDELAVRAMEAGLSAEPVSSIASALKLLRDTWGEAEMPPRIIVCGSLRQAGEALRLNGTIPA